MHVSGGKPDPDLIENMQVRSKGRKEFSLKPFVLFFH